MRDLEIQEQAEKMYARISDADYNVHVTASQKLAQKAFVHGAKWMQEQDEWISVDVKPDKEFADILLYFGVDMPKILNDFTKIELLSLLEDLSDYIPCEIYTKKVIQIKGRGLS